MTFRANRARNLTARKAAMRTNGAYLSADGLSARAGALRAVATGLSMLGVCAWVIAAQVKPATSQMFVDSPNHRTRRLWKPSQ
jgi:hypothetical protein